jgi:hypothetical protein
VGTLENRITAFDFHASDEAILKELSHLFANGKPQEREEAQLRFDRMPKKAKDKIYEELTDYLEEIGHPSEEESAEKAFLYATSDQKAAAIEDYLIGRQMSGLSIEEISP